MSKVKNTNVLNIVVWTPDGGSVPHEVAKEITTAVDKIVKDNRLLQTIVRS